MNTKAIASVALTAFFVWFVAKQASAAANRLDAPEVLAMIKKINVEQFGGVLDPLDILAIAEIESGLDPDAYRYEKHIKDASIGLMQVLYSTAQDRGLRQGPAALFDPVANLKIGMAHFAWTQSYLESRLGHTPPKDMVIGAYNAGVGNALKGNYSQHYVAKFVRARARHD